MGKPLPTLWTTGPTITMPVDLKLIQEEYVMNLIKTLNGIYADVYLFHFHPRNQHIHLCQVIEWW